MKISEILEESIISVGLDAADKTDAINQIVDLANNSGKILNLEKVRGCVLEREKLVSTGVGKGFAIPHGKTDAISDITAAFAILKNPIDFESIDLQPVKFIFLLVGKENLLNAHIKLLSRISRLMNKDEFRQRLSESKTSKEVLEIFKEEEQSFLDV
ncbi:MAG: PTS sugar transporter subunit IIA [Bacteroidetes bacterium]|nr:PTS sugar transporter subunit IIA [Bacteroidota bacterium]MBX7044729.1 PTS sugar transporter subunit IIA [Ignavibacteria bacterium]